jgi:hypothetical protein
MVSMMGVALLLVAISGSADEIIFSDDFSYGIGPTWTVYGSAYEYGGSAIVWSDDEFDSGLESIALERTPGSTLRIQGEYMIVASPSGVPDRGVVGFRWNPVIAHHLEFVHMSGDTLVNRIRHRVYLTDAPFVFWQADLGAFEGWRYMWRFEFTEDGYEISIDEGEGWETRFIGSVELLLPTLHLCLTGAGDGAGYWDDILVTRSVPTPVESMTWGRVKALYQR